MIHRFQVIEQADIVLAMFLLGDKFSLERKRANFDYYDALTTGDSSLSACVQCVIAAEIGDEESALEYFRYALLMDLADVAGNVSDGVHIAAAAGSWMAIVNGFGGVRDYDGRLSLDPHLPRTWRSLEFSLRFRDRQLRIRLGHDEEHFTLVAGHALTVRVRDDHHVLRAGEPLVLTPSKEPSPSGPGDPGVVVEEAVGRRRHAYRAAWRRRITRPPTVRASSSRERMLGATTGKL